MGLSQDEKTGRLAAPAEILHIPHPRRDDPVHLFPVLAGVAPDALAAQTVRRPEVADLFWCDMLDQACSSKRKAFMLQKQSVQGWGDARHVDLMEPGHADILPDFNERALRGPGVHALLYRGNLLLELWMRSGIGDTLVVQLSISNSHDGVVIVLCSNLAGEEMATVEVDDQASVGQQGDQR